MVSLLLCFFIFFFYLLKLGFTHNNGVKIGFLFLFSVQIFLNFIVGKIVASHLLFLGFLANAFGFFCSKFM